MRRTCLIVLVFSVFAAFTARTARADGDLAVGWIGPLTGPASALGVDSPTAMQLVFDEVNRRGGIGGKKLRLFVQDDQYTSSKTVSAYRLLTANYGVKVIVVVTYSGLFSIAAEAERDGVVLIDPLDCDGAIARLPRNVFCVAKNTEDLGVALARYAFAHGEVPPGLIYFDGDAFMGTVANAARAALRDAGATFAFEGTYNDQTGDFKTLLARVKMSGARSLVLLGYDSLGLAVRQARELGVPVPMLALGTSETQAFRDLAGPAIEGLTFPFWEAPRDARYESFITRFSEVKGRPPILDVSTVPSYDVAQLLVQAFPSGSLSGAALEDFLLSVKDYKGLSGTITIDPDGVTRSFKVQMGRITGGKRETVRMEGVSR